jgi:hypothetical protein
MLNRSQRNRAMEKLPQAQALRRLVERRKDAERTRVQLVHRLGNPLGARHARPRIRSWGEGEGVSERW